MLQRLRLTDFKSFVDETVELAPLTLLVGANASGKSNFLDAVRFLQGLGFNQSFDEILNGRKASQSDVWPPGLRGGAAEVARVGTSTFRIESRWATVLNGLEVCHHIACTLSPVPHLIEERLASKDGPLFEARSNTEGALEAVLPREGEIFGQRTTSLYWELDEDQVGLAFHAALLSITFLDLQPTRMRGYGRRNRKRPLGSQGENFSGVLADLCAEPEQRQELVAWLAELCAPELEDLDFIDVKEVGDVLAVLVEKGGRRITARSLSDGTLHFLGTLLALRTAPEGSIVVIEEVAAGLHPTRVKLLIDALESAVRERGLQILATTHSPVVLQWLDEATLNNAIVFGRVPDHEGTIARRLCDLPNLRETLERRGIEDLFSEGWLEMAL